MRYILRKYPCRNANKAICSCYYTSTHFEADIFKRHPEIRVDLNMANIVNANTASKAIQSVLMTLNAGIEIED
jgi:ABC-2 type transport system permease protein